MDKNPIYQKATEATEEVLNLYKKLHKTETSPIGRDLIRIFASVAYNGWYQITELDRTHEDNQRLKKLAEFT